MPLALRTASNPLLPPTLPEPLDNPVGRYLTDPFGTLGDAAAQLLDTLIAIGRAYGLLTLAAIGAVLVGRMVLARWRLARLHQGARFVEILLPPTVNPGDALSFWGNLAGILRQHRWLTGRPHVAFEYRWVGERLTIGLWLPGMVAPRLVEHAVHSAWPGARTRTLSPPPPPLPETPHRWGRGAVAGGRLRLAAPEWFALRTKHDTDPLRALLGAAEELGGGEATVVQVLARPAAGRRLARCRRAATALRQGRSPTRTGRLLDLVSPGPAVRPHTYTRDPDRAAEVREILDKAAGPGWETSLRYAVTTTTGRRPRGRVVSRAHAITAAFALYAGRNQLTRTRLHRPARAIKQRHLGRGDLLSLSEIAALAHLPLDLAAPGVTRAGARSVTPTPEVPTSGKVLGHADSDPHRPIALAPPDARHHLHVMGATGSGKSTLLANLALQDAAAGRGVVVIDPRGDLIRDLLDRLPASAADRLVLMDPDEQHAPPSLNMLEGDPELATDHVISIFRRIFANAWGPRTEDVLRAACLTLLHTGPATLADIPRLLTNTVDRHRILAALPTNGPSRTPAELRAFWTWYDQLTPAGQAGLVGPTLSRLRAFLLRGFVRDLVGATTSSFQMDTVLDGGILLARLPKGILGSDASRLLGSMVVSKVWQAALYRARAGERIRVDAALVVDEAHNFLHLPTTYEEMLAEARGYRLSLALAHQHLAQLPADLREATSSNARTKVWFSMSPEDAHRLAHHVTPKLTEHDLSHLGVYQAAARMVVAGDEVPACTVATRPLPEPVPGRAEVLRAAARQRWGRTVDSRDEDEDRRGLGPDEIRLTHDGDREHPEAGLDGDGHAAVGGPAAADDPATSSPYGSGTSPGSGLPPVDPRSDESPGHSSDPRARRDPDSLSASPRTFPEPPNWERE